MIRINTLEFIRDVNGKNEATKVGFSIENYDKDEKSNPNEIVDYAEGHLILRGVWLDYATIMKAVKKAIRFEVGLDNSK
jgi:hypothetical protein